MKYEDIIKLLTEYNKSHAKNNFIQLNDDMTVILLDENYDEQCFLSLDGLVQHMRKEIDPDRVALREQIALQEELLKELKKKLNS